MWASDTMSKLFIEFALAIALVRSNILIQIPVVIIAETARACGNTEHNVMIYAARVSQNP